MAHDVKVDFVVAGAQKAGTQALRQFLGAHPEIGLSAEPEPHYFDRKIVRDQSGDYAGYHALFSGEALGKCTGDITPVYLWLRDCPVRMQAYNPGFKVIVMLRNPAERAYSQWAMEVQKKKMTGSFLTEILREAWRALILRSKDQDPVFSLVARGFYGRQIERMFAAFPRAQCLVLRNEALSDDHEATLRQIYRFLGVSETEPPEPRRVHSRSYPPMPRLARWLLRAVYARDIRRLETMLGWDLSDWRA